MQIHVIPCLKDNYAYVLKTDEGVYLIDAPEAKPVINFLEERKWHLDFILLTHHHWDHVQGVKEIKTEYGCKVLSSSYDQTRIERVDQGLGDSERFNIFQTVSIPGHTLGHMAFYIEKEKIIFTGDTLFSAGCGRLFEGSPEQMFESLGKIKKFPAETKIYCGHEYTQRNLEFTKKYASNSDVETFYEHVVGLRANNLPTVPTTLELELNVNPFLRSANLHEFIRLRELRNEW